MEIVKITGKNIEQYYDQPNGNIWYREPGSYDFQILDGYSIEECLQAMVNKVEFIFVAVNWRS